MDKCKTGLGYNDIPPPYTRNFFPPKPDLSGLEEFENEHIVTKPTVKKHAVETSEAKASGTRLRKQVSTAHPKSTMNAARQMSYLSKSAHSSNKRAIHKKTSFTNSNVPHKVNNVRSKTINTARPKAVVNAVLGNRVNAVKASAYYEEINRGYVAFGGNPKRGKITGKGNARMETVPGKDYILLPLWTVDPLISQESKSSQDDGFQPSSDDGKKVDDF
nr:hypothetical protein [Tanacetum cinerariifolium]